MLSSTQFNRSKIVLGLILFGLFLIEIRLFYWQILQSTALKSQAKHQITQELEAKGSRGRIFTKNNHLLVGNQQGYQISINKNKWDGSLSTLADKLTNVIIKFNIESHQPASQLQESEFENQLRKDVEQSLLRGSQWIDLPSYLVSLEAKDELKEIKKDAIFLKPRLTRYYPEASMAAHITGFVAKNENGENTGYFGVEGSLNKELEGKAQQRSFLKDALGLTLADQELTFNNLDGRDVTLTIERDVQNLAESQLRSGINQFQAKRGEIIILNPKTGEIMALATWPYYDQSQYYLFENHNFKNPALTDLFEPGSTFKTLTVAAGIDAEAVTPETPCTKCSGPRKIAGYSIRTWNNEYHPNISVSEALVKSDNTGMIFVAESLGSEKFSDYLQNFGIGERIDLDLQEDVSTPFPDKLGPVELATTSFGQGVSVNSLQLIRAVSTIANHGIMMKPSIVKSVYDPQTNKTIEFQPQQVRQVISSDTAQKVTKMMIRAAQKGEAQWIGKNYLVAGKTGTSQIPSPDGGYQENATIASFIGFAPPNDPQFIMLVKLVEPQSSPWAAETAAPLWFKTAQKLLLLLN